MRLLVSILVATAAATAPAAAATYDVAALLDWAERTYPQLFPGPQRTVSSPPYLYRCYPTGNCAGAADGTVYLYGPVVGGALVAIGPMAQFECLVLPQNCAALELPRLEASDQVVVARDSAGRHLAWGENRYLTATDGEAVAGTRMRVVASGARQVIVHTFGGLVLAQDGSARSWGSLVNATYASPKPMPMRGPVRMMGLSQSSYASVLLEEGSVWLYPTDRTSSGVPRGDPLPLPAPPQVTSLARVTDTSSSKLYFVTAAGEVWILDTSVDPLRQSLKVGTLDNMRSIACGREICSGLRRDGTAVVWSVFTDRPEVVVGPTDIRQLTMASRGIPLNPSANATRRDLEMAAAVASSGQLWVWRGGGFAQAEAGFTDVTDASCAISLCVIRRADGSIWGWGDTASSRVRAVLGDGASAQQILRVPGVSAP